MLKQRLLYREVTDIAEDYLGPVAPRFIDRIIENHLHIPPSEMTAKDLPKLITWVKLSVSLVTDQQDDIDEFVSRLEHLTNGSLGSLASGHN